MSNKLSPIKPIVTGNVPAPVKARNRVNGDPGRADPFQSVVQRAAASMPNGNSQLIREASLWALNITAVFFATYYLFGMNDRGIFFGYDSQSFRTLFGISYRLSETLFGLGSDFVNGIGNVSADPNPRWFPSVLLTSPHSGVLEDGPLAFAIGATELFVATLLCGRALSISLTVSIAAGWLITLSTWPLFVMPKIVTLWFFTPTHAEILNVSVIVTTAALYIGARPFWRSILLAAIAFLGITHIVLGAPTNLSLVGPFIAISVGVSILSSNRGERPAILLCWATVAVACFALGYFHYIWGLFAYTATNFFPEVWNRPHTLFQGQTTLLLWTPVSQFTPLFLFTPQRLFVGGGIIGAVALLFLGSSRQRRLALSVLVAEALFLSFGFTNYFWPFWFGPEMGYFEMMLFPYFALCTCFIAFLPARLLWRIIRNCFASPEFRSVPRIVDGVVAVVLPLSIGLYAAAIGPDVREESQRYVGFAIASVFPQHETPITRILKAEARLVLGEPFRGRIASIWGRSPAVLNRGAVSQVHYFSQLATGNLHDGPGLSQDDIPIWAEYNRLMTPALFVFQQYLYKDLRLRMLNAGDLRLHMLRAAGVRFVITDAPMPEAKLRAELTIPTPPSAQQQLLLSSQPAFESFQLYLYELENSNLGQFSPIEVKQLEDAPSVREPLQNPIWELDHTVFGVIPGTGPFQKASLESFTIARDGYKVRAQSEGSAILLLPIQFSRCLTVRSRVDGPLPRLFRADLVLTGVLFDRRLDADISFRVGPGEASRCRLQDLNDAERMQLRNAL
jgi:hypothetical protein